MDLTECFLQINFVRRYKDLCSKHNHFDKNSEDLKKATYEAVLKRFKYKTKYYASESFYQITEQSGSFKLSFHLVLKRGIIDTILAIESQEAYCTPGGPLCGIPEMMGEPFGKNDKKYPRPLYSTESDLEEILRELFSIYEDLKEELKKEICGGK